jgi:DNA-binding IclR family transcriptional regulator
MTKASSESPSVAVERALAMLEAVALDPDGLSNAAISRKLDIPKSSASYILRTLESRGYLTRDAESGRYRVGLKILSLSRGALGGRDVRGVALPIMRHLTLQTGLTCHLAVLDGPDAVYIEKVEPEGFIRMDTWVSHRCLHSAGTVGSNCAQEWHGKAYAQNDRDPSAVAQGVRKSARSRLGSG